jgi:hypothetical protein
MGRSPRADEDSYAAGTLLRKISQKKLSSFVKEEG